MSIIVEDCKVLLIGAQRVVRHQEEIKQLRGEHFNVFTILNMESKENATHSAFLGELLDPHGSHFKGNLFLKLFLQTIKHEGFDIATAKVELEHVIGSRNDVDKTGGRIDIFLQDKRNNFISIENKIYAIDQFAQIERYINYKKGRNTVYYLTLGGNEPSDASKGNLTEDDNYYCISYRHTIIEWLTLCLKESVEQPILRESIKQYIILLKKLTNQLTDNAMATEIQDLIQSHYHSAKLVQQNIAEVEAAAVHSFLLSVKQDLERLLQTGWLITVDEKLHSSYSGIQITNNKWNGVVMRLQGEAKLIGGRSIYGIVAHRDHWDRIKINKRLQEVIPVMQGDFKSSAHWPYYQFIDLFIDSDQDSIPRLFDPNKRGPLVTKITALLLEMAKACEEPLAGVERLENK